MSFPLVPKSVTLNGVITLILCYFTEFVYDVVAKQLLGLLRFQNLLLIVYDHNNTTCAIIWAKQTLVTRFDGRRYISHLLMSYCWFCPVSHQLNMICAIIRATVAPIIQIATNHID